MPIPLNISASNVSAARTKVDRADPTRADPTGDKGDPTLIEPSLLACLALLSLGRQEILCDRSAVRVNADEKGRHHVEISLPYGDAGDALHYGARVAKGVSDDLALVQRPGSVRVAFS
jgi:hypothetical protein